MTDPAQVANPLNTCRFRSRLCLSWGQQPEPQVPVSSGEQMRNEASAIRERPGKERQTAAPPSHPTLTHRRWARRGGESEWTHTGVPGTAARAASLMPATGDGNFPKPFPAKLPRPVLKAKEATCQPGPSLPSPSLLGDIPSLSRLPWKLTWVASASRGPGERSWLRGAAWRASARRRAVTTETQAARNMEPFLALGAAGLG